MVKSQTRSANPIIGVALGVIATLMLTVGFAVVIALLILNEKISDSAGTYFEVIAQFVASIVGLVITGKTVTSRIAIYMGCSAVLYFIITAAVGLLLLDGQLALRPGTIVAVIAAYILACAICIRNRKRKRFRKIATR